MRTLPCLLLAAALASAPGLLASAEPVDNCATVLGSIRVELHFARDLPPGRKTTYVCAKRYASLVGASRARILRSLGTPDRNGEDGGWSYFFASRHGELPPGTPELVFHFGGEDVVESVDCRRTTG
jgi:hypothetical protein